jgi:putative phage-type endonuclease
MKKERQSEKQRAGYIGGSDAAIIMGMNPWKNRVELYMEKVGIKPAADLSRNQRVQWGIKLEDMVARHWAEVTGKKVRRNNFLLRSEQWPWMAAHLDRQVAGGGFLEVKTAGQAHGWGEDGGTEIPDHYMCQVQHYMAITGDERCWVAVLIGGSDFRSYEIQRNQPFIDLMVEAQRDFWLHVEMKQCPEPLTADECISKWPTSWPNRPAEADADVLEAVHEIAALDEKLKVIGQRKKELQAQVMKSMEMAEVLLSGGKKVASWKGQTSERIDTTRLKEEKPMLAAAYMKQTSSRVFRIHLK